MISVSRSQAGALVDELRAAGVPAAEVGEVLTKRKPLIEITGVIRSAMRRCHEPTSHRMIRSSPARRVTCSRSRYSSSGMAYLRETPASSLN